MKKVSLALTLLLVIVLTLGLVSCNECEHEFGEWTVSEPATCSTDGQKVRTCSLCQHSETAAYRDENVHTFGEWEEDVAPTCTDKGTDKRVCTGCGAEEERETDIIENAHAFGEWVVTKEATCSRQGEQKRVCSHCETEEKAIIAKLTEGGHSYGAWQISIEPTCSANGQRVKICDDCEHRVYETLSPLDEGGHSYAEWYTVTEATCSAEGVKMRDCVYCDDKQTGVIPVREDGGHSFGDWVVSVEPTCSTEGEKKRQCTLCQSFEIVPLAPLDEGGHTYGVWVETVKPTCDTVGEERRECGLCDEFEVREVDKLPVVYTITVNCDGKTTVVNLPAGGIYTLTAPTKLGYTFVGFTDGENSFALQGAVTENKVITAHFEVTPTLTFTELKTRIEGGVDKIKIGADIVLTDTIYLSDSCEIYADANYTLTRSPDFLGDLFVLGENANGEISIMNGKKAVLTFKPNEGATITIDGNRENLSGVVKGTVFFMINGSVLNMYDGTVIKNHLKLSNEKIFDPAYTVNDPLIGGSVAIIDDGTFNMYGGEISNNAVNLKYCSATPEEERVEGYTDSSYGGAIYSIGAVNIYGGLIDGNQASYAGAIFTSRTLNIEGGIISNNSATSYGGALFGSNNASGINYIGSPEGNKKEINVIFRGNSAKGGGAIYQQYNNATVIFGNVLFDENEAWGKMGGAIFTGGELIIYYAEFKNNIAADRGGALYGTYTSASKDIRVIDIKEAVFDGNSAARGGAIAASATSEAEDSGAIFELGNVTFRNNVAFKTESSTPTFIDNVDREGVKRNYNGNGAVAHFTAKCEIHIYGNVVFEDNYAESKGGALYLTNEAKVKTLTGSTVIFDGNTSVSYGGALYLTNGSGATLTGAVFTENQGSRGGAIALLSSGEVKLDALTANMNKATGSGGFAYLELSTLKITAQNGATAITNNEAIGSSAGVFYLEGAKLELVGSESSPILITDNIAASQGGVICAYIGSISTTVTDEQTGESTTTTESIRSNITVNYVRFEDNVANASSEYGGGAIYASNSDLDIKNSVFNKNEAVYGGAISLYSGAVLTAEDTAFTNNVAKINGGVMYTSKSTANFKNITVSGNTATGYEKEVVSVDEETGEETTTTQHVNGVGGAFFFNSTSTASFDGVTASGNSADNGGFATVGYSTVTVSGTNVFTENIARASGGVFYVNNDATLELTGVSASKNEAQNGGFIYATEATLLKISGEGNVVSENKGKSTSDQYGAGALYIYKTVASISGTTFHKNSGNCGGAVGVRASDDVEFTNCIFTENSGTGTGGAFYLNTSTITLTGCTLSGNTSGGNGGAIYSTTCTINTNNSVFKSNSATGYYGGVIYMTKTTHNSVGDTFELNTAKNGGAVAINSNSTFNVSGAQFKDNTATSNGGAIWVGGTTVDITSTTITGNTAAIGGGIYISGSSTVVTANDLTVSGNTANLDSADGKGGGIYVSDGTVTITDLTLNNNSAAHGGGLATVGGTVTVNGISATGNNATGYTNTSTQTMTSGNGGAINAGVGTLTIGKGTKITCNTFTTNRANSAGGAIYIYNTATAFSANEIVATGNIAAGNYGGALYLRGASVTVDIGTLTMTNNSASGHAGGAYFYAFKGGKIGTVIANGNTSGSDGGAIYIAGSAELTIDSLSGEGNEAAALGGMLKVGTSTLLIKSGNIGVNTDQNEQALNLVVKMTVYEGQFTYVEGSLNDTSKLVVVAAPAVEN